MTKTAKTIGVLWALAIFLFLGATSVQSSWPDTPRPSTMIQRTPSPAPTGSLLPAITLPPTDTE